MRSRTHLRQFIALSILALGGCIKVGIDDGPRFDGARADTVPAAAVGSLLLAAFAAVDSTLAHDTAARSGVAGPVQRIAEGRYDLAIDELRSLRGDSTGRPLRAVRTLTTLALSAEERWSELPDSASAGGADSDARLQRAFAGAARESIGMASSPVRVPLEQSRSGSPVVEVVIGTVRKKFWIDTGAELTVISSDLAGELGLRPVPGVAVLIGTSTKARVVSRPTVVPSLRVGALEVRNHPAMILDADDLELGILGIPVVKIDGIIGWNLIRKLRLEFDFIGGTLTIDRPPPSAGGARNLIWLGYPMVVAAGIHGEPLLLGLDTGANRTALSPAFARATGATVGPAKSKLSIGAGGFERQSVRQVANPVLRLTSGSLTFPSVDVGVQPPHVSKLIELHGVLGIDVAQAGIVIIDFPNGRFELRPRSAPAPAGGG